MVFLPTPVTSSVTDAFLIVHIDRTSVFSGKSGREVRETWTASRDGREFTVIVSPYHTNVAGTRLFAEGDTVILKGTERSGVVRVCLSEIKRP